MSIDMTVKNLKSLKLHGMASSIVELTQQDITAYERALPLLDILIQAELADREVRSIAYQMKAAKFPVYRDQASFDFSQSDAMKR